MTRGDDDNDDDDDDDDDDNNEIESDAETLDLGDDSDEEFDGGDDDDDECDKKLDGRGKETWTALPPPIGMAERPPRGKCWNLGDSKIRRGKFTTEGRSFFTADSFSSLRNPIRVIIASCNLQTIM